MKTQRKAFTAIELLITITILVILAAILIMGLRAMADRAKVRTTQTTIENMKSMLANYTARNKDNDIGTLPAVEGLDLTAELLTPDGAHVNDYPPAPLFLASLGRYGNAAIQTQRILRKALSLPENQSLMSKFPTEQRMPLMWASSDPSVPAYLDPSTKDVMYQVGDQVARLNGKNLVYFRCIQNIPPGGSTTPPESDSTYWVQTTEHVPLLLDGWGNPIIFVPARGLMIRNHLQPAGSGPGPGLLLKLVASTPLATPFFASGGPDGHLEGRPRPTDLPADQNLTVVHGTDDNVYSFEN